jgi:hypothetical protein
MEHAKHLLARGVPVQTQTTPWPCVPRALEDLAINGAVVTFRARRVFFVSHHNLEDVQQCLDMELPNADVIWSPVNRGSILRAMRVTLPNIREGSLRLACVARLNVHAKGQDVLLKTLALEKWKARDVSLTLLGEGPHRRGCMATHFSRS